MCDGCWWEYFRDWHSMHDSDEDAILRDLMEEDDADSTISMDDDRVADENMTSTSLPLSDDAVEEFTSSGSTSEEA